MLDNMNPLKIEKYNFFQSQIDSRIKFFYNHWIEISQVLTDTYSLSNYEKFENINYAFAKLDNALKICNFLRKIQKEANNDTDKIIITTLISLSESVQRLNNPDETNIWCLVQWFFKPISNQLEYKINLAQSTYESGIAEKIYIKNSDKLSVKILYLIRNDYIHNWNFTWNFFLNSKLKSENQSSCNYSCLYFSTEKDKSTLFNAWITCRLTFDQFLSIFLDAFKIAIETYLRNN